MSEHQVDRRRFLRTAAAGTALTSIAAIPVAAAPVAAAPTAAPDSRPSAAKRQTATLRWLGTSGWRIDVGARTLLIDPYLTRFPTGLFTGAFDPATALTVDTSAVAAHVGKPENVFVTHTHWDHFNDVPHVATTTGARVFGTLTAYHLGLASGVPTAQLSPVKGGEVLEFGDYSVEVVSALHSRNASYSMAFPGVRTSPAVPAPQTIADLPEGDTLSYQVSVTGGPSVFFMGASDFVERNLRGLRPDVAMLALPSSTATHDYVPRLIEALDSPAVVVPVHWDNFETPLQNPPIVAPADAQRLTAFEAAIRQVAPRTTILRPQYATPYTF
ncbi:MBL fold metallo-hydrolase [Catellatospora sichuanensis]|uniref:MBL fold metallo-hydrolase n=1 Tax=Catellatospora sichuanensis TaxID=1969805 RepID=UPI00118417B5|nr:MBL fold metallo-hydrolase [Catellatospora sichuanensis]